MLILKQMTILGEKIIAKERINLMFNFLHNSQRLEVTKMSFSK